MKKIFWFYLLILFLSACYSVDEQIKDDFPYKLIHEKFSYSGFEVPPDWEVVSIQADVRHRYQDWEEPENHRYDDVPYRYSFIFGREAPTNESLDKEIDSFNDKQELAGETTRQIYYHTYYEQYGILEISKNGFTTLLSSIEGTEEWNIDGERFLVLRRGNEWLLNWFIKDTYYDLIISGEANISSESQFEQLLKEMFLN